MIAEDTQPPAHRRESQPRLGTTPDVLRTPADDAPVGTTGRLTAGRSAPGLEGGAERAAAALKPRMRGWLHAGLSPLALIGGIALIAVSRSAAEVAACSVYALSACLLFATSAVYHRGTWGSHGEAVLRRLDHADGTFTVLDTLDGRYLSTEINGSFTGRVIGLYAASGTAHFDWFDYAPLDE